MSFFCYIKQFDVIFTLHINWQQTKCNEIYNFSFKYSLQFGILRVFNDTNSYPDTHNEKSLGSGNGFRRRTALISSCDFYITRDSPTPAINWTKYKTFTFIFGKEKRTKLMYISLIFFSIWSWLPNYFLSIYTM